jgi:uncharacterized protein (DUF1697 family)
MAQVVLLRGVNVGGHRTFRPSVLAKELAHLGVVNVGAAGTFVVRESIARAALRAEFARRLPFETEVMICAGSDVLRLEAEDPFGARGAQRDIVPFVSLMGARPRSTLDLPMDVPKTGPWGLRLLGQRGRFVLGVYRREMAAIGNLGKLDALLGVPVTTRNWNTIVTIARLLRA